MAVAAQNPGPLAAPYFGIEVHHLAYGVDAGIGPTRAMDGHRAVGHPGDCNFQHFLNSGLLALSLEAKEPASVILNAEYNAVLLSGPSHASNSLVRPTADSIFGIVGQPVQKRLSLFLLRWIALAHDLLQQRAG